MTLVGSTTWTSEAPDAVLPVAESVPKKTLPEWVKRFLAARTDGMAASDASGMPPVVQFIMNAIAWCRTKFKSEVSNTAPLRMVSQLPLGGKKSLCLIEADGVHFLVGGGADSVTVIVPVGAASALANVEAQAVEVREQ